MSFDLLRQSKCYYLNLRTSSLPIKSVLSRLLVIWEKWFAHTSSKMQIYIHRWGISFFLVELDVCTNWHCWVKYILQVTAVGHAAILAAIQRYVPSLVCKSWSPWANCLFSSMMSNLWPYLICSLADTFHLRTWKVRSLEGAWESKGNGRRGESQWKSRAITHIHTSILFWI